MANIVIREVAVGDAAGIATLMSELGYPTSPGQMERRLSAISHDKDYDTLAAFDGTDIVGFAGARSGHLYEDDALYGQVMALVVAPALRRGGVGRLLIRAVEARLIDRGVSILVVASGNQRADAHAFYESQGYSFTGRRYKKSLAVPA